MLGGADDAINQGTGWSGDIGRKQWEWDQHLDGQTYQIYQGGEASLLVDTDMTVAV